MQLFPCPHQPGNLRITEQACIACQKKAIDNAEKKLDITMWLAFANCLDCSTGREIAQRNGVDLPPAPRRFRRCRVPWCDGEATHRGLCRSHYNSWHHNNQVMVDLFGPFEPVRKRAHTGWQKTSTVSVYTAGMERR